MGSEPKELAGADLRLGVPFDSLAETQPLVGHANGEALLLVRRGEEVFAIGATCTHYSGPLAEGIITGEFIRCPWHHTCFSLRTGEAVAPPALNPVPRWRTTVENGTVFVHEKIEAAAVSASAGTTHPGSVVIVGAGAAGMLAAETLRNEGYGGAITLVDPDADAPYDRPNLSKDYLAGTAPEEWMQLRSPGYYAEREIERIVDAVVAIHPKRRLVTLSSGSQLPFGALLLATGSAPIRPPIPGHELPHVHVLRSLADSRRLISAVEHGGRVVIAGASFIGMEAAASLRARGADVTVVAPDETPFARILGNEIGTVLRRRHEEHGVHFHLGRMIAEIRARDVVLDNGDCVEAGTVLLGVGVRPSVELASAAGLVVDDGIIVDRYLETSASGIFAAGDNARFTDARNGELIRIEHWVVAERQGQCAARNILGARQPFESVPFFWTQQYDVQVSYVGHAPGWDEAHVDGDPADLDCTVAYLRNDHIMAVATMNRDQVSLRAEVALEHHDREALEQVTHVS